MLFIYRQTVWLSTAPFQPVTHWYQVSYSIFACIVRFVQIIVGNVLLKVDMQSFISMKVM